MSELFILLYPLVTVVSIAAYIPQIKALLFAKTDCRDMSISCWLTWIGTGAISLGYGITHLNDMLFCITCGTNLIACMLVASLIFYRQNIWKPPYNRRKTDRKHATETVRTELDTVRTDGALS